MKPRASGEQLPSCASRWCNWRLGCRYAFTGTAGVGPTFAFGISDLLLQGLMMSCRPCRPVGPRDLPGPGSRKVCEVISCWASFWRLGAMILHTAGGQVIVLSGVCTVCTTLDFGVFAAQLPGAGFDCWCSTTNSQA